MLTNSRITTSKFSKNTRYVLNVFMDMEISSLELLNKRKNRTCTTGGKRMLYVGTLLKVLGPPL